MSLGKGLEPRGKVVGYALEGRVAPSPPLATTYYPLPFLTAISAIFVEG